MTKFYSSNGVVLTECDFGVVNDKPVKKFTWQTESEFAVSVISYGAIIQSIKVPDRNGIIRDVALGFDDLNSYLTLNTPDLLGAVVGRCVGRLAHGTFRLDGVEYQLTRNCGPHHLHGGTAGFDKVNWNSTVDKNKVIFSCLSKDGEQGYPGDLITSVSYQVQSDDTLHVEYTALTDKKTVVNLSNHSYFNLAGHKSGADGLCEHTVAINADKVLEGDLDWVPTGKLLDVGGTALDLRIPRLLGDVISMGDVLRFHHNFVVNRSENQDLTFVARVDHPLSGRFMEVHSDQPSVIFYTGNYIKSKGHPHMVGKEGVVYGPCGGLCLETMNLVDAIHHDKFPSPVLKPGDVYRHRAVFRYGAVPEPVNSSSNNHL